MTERQERQVATIREVYPGLIVESVRPFSVDGQFNDILIVNETLIFRFARYAEGAQTLSREIGILRAIRKRVSLPVPDPVFTGKGFMGYRLLPGQPLWREELAAIQDDRTCDRFARQLAGFMRELHAIRPDSAEFNLPVRDGLAEWKALYAEICSHLFEYMRPDARKAAKEHFETFFDSPKLHTYLLCLRHGDFGGSNILYNPAQMQISGIIDFGFAGIGDPAIDLAGVSTFGEDFFARICHFYPVTDTMLARAAFYRGTYALQEALHGWKNKDHEAFENGMESYL